MKSRSITWRNGSTATFADDGGGPLRGGRGVSWPYEDAPSAWVAFKERFNTDTTPLVLRHTSIRPDETAVFFSFDGEPPMMAFCCLCECAYVMSPGKLDVACRHLFPKPHA